MDSNNLSGSKSCLIPIDYWAAEGSNKIEQYDHLDSYHQNEDDIKKDEVQAFECYKKLAEQGDIDAQCDLGYLYKNGEILKKKFE
jgi:TPR repeat protein